MTYQYEIVTWEEGKKPPAWSALPQSWQQRIDRHHNQQKRWQSAYGYLLLAKLVGVRPLPELAVSQQGKVYFPDFPEIYVNLSHTKGAAMAAVSTLPVGVDIERIRPMSALMMQTFGNTQDVNAFFKTWVGLEATGKCIGTGLDAHGRVLGDATGVEPVWVDAPTGYQAAVAVKIERETPIV